MGRPRKPTAVLELNGAFRKDPQRRRPEEPRDARALGDPPERLPVDVVPFWRELVDQVQGGVLTYRDRWAVELAARLMAKAVGEQSASEIMALIESAELESNDIKALLKRETISSAELSTLRSLLAALGMTPADRSKLSVPTEKPKNAFADLAAQAQALQ